MLQKLLTQYLARLDSQAIFFAKASAFMGKNEKAITLDREAPIISKRIQYSAAWNAGYSFGKKLEDKIKLKKIFWKST